MDIPEEVQALVDQLGEALVAALVNDTSCRALAARIQDQGFDLALAIEATVALTLRGARPEIEGEEGPEPDFSEDDRNFLRKFKISLE
jgi:hypothetical protein